MKSLLHCIDLVSEWTGKITSLFILAMSLVIGYEVVARYVLVRPTVWAHETSAMVFGAYIVLGGAYTLRMNGHVNVDIIYGSFSPRGRALLDVLTFCGFALFCGVLVWKGGESAWISMRFLEHSGTIWNPPIYHMKFITFIGCLLLLLQGLAGFVRNAIILLKGAES